jgi:hypothetical protein
LIHGSRVREAFRRGRRLLPGRLASEQGSSLVEIAATLLIISIVMLAIMRGFASLQQDSASTDVRLQNLDEARVLMSATAKDLRTATRLQADLAPFVVAADRDVQFYANLNTQSAPELVHIYVDGNNQLIETSLKADVGSQPPLYGYHGTPTLRLVGRYIASPPNPIFRYYDADGNQLTSTPLSADDALAVVSVGITFAVSKTNAYGVPVTTLVNRVYLPNVYFNPISTP